MKKLIANNSAYLLKPGHDLLFKEAREWLSDLKFYETELMFLIKLLDKAFLRVTGREETKVLDKYEQAIVVIREKTLNDLIKKVMSHEDFLSRSEEDKFSKSDDKVWEVHDKLKEKVLVFTDEMKSLKKDIFKVVEKKIVRAKKNSKDFIEGNIAL